MSPFAFPRSHDAVELQAHAEYAVMRRGALDPQAVWALPASAFRPVGPELLLDLPEDAMLVLRVAFDVPQLHDPDYLQLPSSRLDRVRFWARSEGGPWQTAQSGDHVPPADRLFISPYPAFELPSASSRTQVVLALEHRGRLNVPVQWLADDVFRAERLEHGFCVGLLTGLAMALALACLLALWFYRQWVFGLLALYALLFTAFVVANNGYGVLYLWPWFPQLDDPGKPMLSMLLGCLLVPLTALVLNADVHKRTWWVGAWRWGVAGLVYAIVQAYVLPPEWRTLAWLVYLGLSLLFSAMLALHGVLRADAMSAYALAAIGLLVVSMGLSIVDLTRLHNSLLLDAVSLLCRMGFVVLMLGVAVQRHRFGRDVLSRAVTMNSRDALTGLLTRPAFEHALSRVALLTEHASAFSSGFLVCELRSLGTVRAEYGEEVCERVLVRFASILQRTLHSDTIIGRTGYARFAAVLLHDVEPVKLQEMATQVLTRALAQTDLPNFSRELKLRMVLAQMPISRLDLGDLERRANAAMAGGDRLIRWL